MPSFKTKEGKIISLAKKRGKSGRAGAGLTHLTRTWVSESGEVIKERPGLQKLLIMWQEPALELAMTYKFVPQLNARRRWKCTDLGKAQFFKELFDPILDDLLKHILTSFVVRYAGFALRYDLGESNMAGWSGESAPLVIDKVVPLPPATIKVDFDQKADRYLGIIQNGDEIQADYTLWHTHSADRVFGNLYGWSDIESADDFWFTKYLCRALMDRHVEDRAVPPFEVRHPSEIDGSGMVTDPDTGEQYSLAELARGIGEDLRSGDVISLPSDVWFDPVTNTFTDREMWRVGTVEIADATDTLIKVPDRMDVEMFRCVHIAPSILLKMGEGWQSGKSVDNLVSVLWDVGLVDAAEIDKSLNLLVKRLDRWNFPADSPPIRVETVGLSSKDKTALGQLAVVLANRPGGGGLDEVMDAPRFWEELGVPVKEEGAPVISLPTEEEMYQARKVEVKPEVGEKIVAKFDQFPQRIATGIEATSDHVTTWLVAQGEAVASAVEAITDEEWARAEGGGATLFALKLYSMGDLDPLLAEMSDVQKLVFYNSVWTGIEIGEWADRLYDESLRHAEASLLEAGYGVWVDFDGMVELTDAALLADLKARAWDAANSIAATHNVEVARQVIAIRKETPTANRFVYAKRLRDWSSRRAKWKGPQIALSEAGRSIENVIGRFLAKNRIFGGEFTVEPPTWAVPECRYDCKGYVLGGPYDMAEWENIGPFPLHPNCPHHKEIKWKSLLGVPDREGAWFG